MPYNYLSRAEWTAAWSRAGLAVDQWESSLNLYPAPASWVFERGLHFAARLAPVARHGSSPQVMDAMS